MSVGSKEKVGDGAIPPAKAAAPAEESFLRSMFLVRNPSRHWLARRIVQATRVKEPTEPPR